MAGAPLPTLLASLLSPCLQHSATQGTLHSSREPLLHLHPAPEHPESRKQNRSCLDLRLSPQQDCVRQAQTWVVSAQHPTWVGTATIS